MAIRPTQTVEPSIADDEKIDGGSVLLLQRSASKAQCGSGVRLSFALTKCREPASIRPAGRYREAGVALSKRLIAELSEVFAHRAALEFI